MFNKAKCSHCGKKFDNEFSYCPFCGSRRFEKQEDFFQKGMLDEIGEFPKMGMHLPAMFSKILGDLDKEFRQMDKGMKLSDDKKMPITSGISISVNMSNDGKPEVKINRFGNSKTNVQVIGPNNLKEKEQFSKSSKKSSEKDSLAKLPHEEPKTTVRRFSDRISYEIDLPNVEKKNVIVNKLENSIEVKAFSKNKAFLKLIPVSLPLKKWTFKDGKLVLELKPEA